MVSNLGFFVSRWLLLIVAQVLVLNNVLLFGSINPYLYILVLLWLPVNMNKMLVMLLAFITGIVIDAFTNSWGLHASACVTIAYFRPVVFRLLAPRDGYDLESIPSVKSFGFAWFFSYSLTLVVIHHVFLFTIEYFKWVSLGLNLKRAFFSILFTQLLISILSFAAAISKKNEG